MSNEIHPILENQNSSSFSIIQGVANEVLLAMIATLLLIFYFVLSAISFFRLMPPRAFNFREIMTNIRNSLNNQNNANPNADPGNNNIPVNGPQEFVSENNCSICLNQIQYEITTSCFHLFCG